MKVGAHPSVAGTTALYLENWSHLSSDRSVLQNVSGIRLEFDSEPIQPIIPRQYVCSKEQSDFINKEVSDLLDKGVIVRVSDAKGCFISNVFLRPKSNSKWRLIIDLSELNQFVTKHHFKMEHLDVASRLMFTDAWLASIDLKDAYYTLPVHPEDRKFLCFRWNNDIYKFTCLPFGLSSAPWLFTKTLRPIFAKFHEEGFQGFGYIDDSFIIAETFEECQQAVSFLGNLFTDLGFRVNTEKSILTPTKQLTFLGYILDTQDMSISPTPDKKSKIRGKIEEVIAKNNLKIREIASLCGSLNDTCKGSEYGHSHVKSLEIQKNRALVKAGTKQFEGKIFLNRFCFFDLTWWLKNIDSAKKVIQVSPPELTLTTDASSQGWGACFQKKSTGGPWSEDKKLLHINVLELKAVYLGLNTFENDLNPQDVLIRSDNTTTIAYIAHGGGTKSTNCNQIAKDIWSWAEANKCWLMPTFVPGCLNVEADHESRVFSENTEWQLNVNIFREISGNWGIPDIDLFASRLNNQVPVYASWGPDPHSLFVDAFTRKWSHFQHVYAFPPFRLLNRVLQKVRREGVKATIIAPDWAGQPWFSPLRQAAVHVIRFPRKQGNLLLQGFQIRQKESLQNIPLIAHLIL